MYLHCSTCVIAFKVAQFTIDVHGKTVTLQAMNNMPWRVPRNLVAELTWNNVALRETYGVLLMYTWSISILQV